MRYEVSTKRTPQDVIQHAITHFGPQGMGLQVVDRNEACLIMQGGGGHVAMTACAGKTPGEKTTVEIETREWDYAVRQFMEQVH